VRRLLTGIAIGIVCTGCAMSLTALARTAPTVTREGVQFVTLQPDAQRVSVAGSFNQWSALSHPLERRSTAGIWTGVIPLPPGEHLFMYVVDDARWISPAAADDYADDGFGARNGIVIVREKEK
jgi:1,4-alpha-glucan branching enzyme